MCLEQLVLSRYYTVIVMIVTCLSRSAAGVKLDKPEVRRDKGSTAARLEDCPFFGQAVRSIAESAVPS